MTVRNITIVDYSSATITSTAGTILARADSGSPSTLPVGARSFVGSVLDNPVRARGDGTAPTASEGELINAGEPVYLDEQGIKTMQFIRAVAADAVIKGHFYNVELAVLLALRYSTGIQGLVASDAPESGNPVMIGGSVDDTSPAAAAEGDARRFRSTPDGNQIVEIYRDNISVAKIDDGGFTRATDPILAIGARADEAGISSTSENSLGVLSMNLRGQLHITPARKGTSDNLSNGVAAIGTTSASRATAVTPASGKRIQIISVQVTSRGLTTDPGVVSVYFGTGADFTTNTDSNIAAFTPGTTGQQSMSWADGAGPLGAIDAVLSWRTELETETALWLHIVWREATV